MIVRKPNAPPLASVLGSSATVSAGRIAGDGPAGRLPLTADQLREEPSGNLFGLTQNVGMGWSPAALRRTRVRHRQHHGWTARQRRSSARARVSHRTLGDRTARATKRRRRLRARGAIPFAAYCSDPCDGRTQGTTGMFDSLRLPQRRRDRDATAHSLAADGVRRHGHRDVRQRTARDDARAGRMQFAFPASSCRAASRSPPTGAEDAGQVQSLGARFAHDLITLDYAAEMGCRACGSSGGGCQFLGTAATSQVVAEAFGLGAAAQRAGAVRRAGVARARRALRAGAHSPARARHSASTESSRSGRSRTRCSCTRRLAGRRICCCTFRRSRTRRDSTPPTVDDWNRVNQCDAAACRRAAERTARSSHGAGVHGGRRARSDAASAAHGTAQRRRAHRDGRHARHDARLVGDERPAARARAIGSASGARSSPDDVIMSPDAARRAGFTSTVVFPAGNLAPEELGRESDGDRSHRWSMPIRCIGIAGRRACSPTSAKRSAR